MLGGVSAHVWVLNGSGVSMGVGSVTNVATPSSFYNIDLNPSIRKSFVHQAIYLKLCLE